MRLHFSLGHLRLDLALCEPDEEAGYVHELTADTTIAEEPVTFGFDPGEDD